MSTDMAQTHIAPKRDDRCNEIYAALAKAQGEMSFALKDTKNNYFNSSYADLTEVIKASRPHLFKHGLCVTQTVSYSILDSKPTLELTTILGHSSGQSITSHMPIITAKLDPQSIGSAITYARRYAMAAITGVSADDDDGEKAMGRGEVRQTQKMSITAAQHQALAKLIDSIPKAWSILMEKLGITGWDDINPNNYDRLYASLDKYAKDLKKKVDERNTQLKQVAK